MKKALLQIMGGATVALIIPLLASQFVEGWGWTWNDYIFAWVFWVVMGTSIYVAAQTFPKYKLAIGLVVFFGFAGI